MRGWRIVERIGELDLGMVPPSRCLRGTDVCYQLFVLLDVALQDSTPPWLRNPLTYIMARHERPGTKRLSRTPYRRHSKNNNVTCTKLAIFPAGTVSFGHAAGWNDYADRNGMSDNTSRASSRHSHTWICDEDGHLVAPETHCPGVLWRHDALLSKRHVRILLLCPPSAAKKTLDSIRVSDVRKLAFLLGGTNGKTSGDPKDGPVWFGSRGSMP